MAHKESFVEEYTFVKFVSLLVYETLVLFNLFFKKKPVVSTGFEQIGGFFLMNVFGKLYNTRIRNICSLNNFLI